MPLIKYGNLKTIKIFFYIVVSSYFLLWSKSLLKNENSHIKSLRNAERKFVTMPKYNDFKKTLEMYSDNDKFIILAYIDPFFTDMAINFYLTSLKRFNITNFLFVGAGNDACKVLLAASIQCYTFYETTTSNIASNYRSADFFKKVNKRPTILLQVLNFGFSFFHVDVDVVFLQNPIFDIKTILLKNEMAGMWDSGEFNSGTVAVKPNIHTIKLYEQMKKISTSLKTAGDQHSLNRAYSIVKKVTTFRIHIMDKKKYLCGVYYFENGDRLLVGKKCDGCLVVHNNWIVSKDAKIFRFKEHKMWMIDDNKYYSDADQLYLTYDNPTVFSSWGLNLQQEMNALKFGIWLSKMLNRKLILPKFHCLKNNKNIRKNKLTSKDFKLCPLNNLILISNFHQAFNNVYRESSFLSHPLVPVSVKESISPVITIFADRLNNQSVFTQPFSTDGKKHFNISKLLYKITNYKQFRVLKFNNFYNTNFLFNTKNISLAFKSGDYRQLKLMSKS